MGLNILLPEVLGGILKFPGWSAASNDLPSSNDIGIRCGYTYIDDGSGIAGVYLHLMASGGYGAQIKFNVGDNIIKSRSCAAGTWTGWKTIQVQ